MKLKSLAMAALAMALTAGGTVTSYAAGWTSTANGWKYDWGNGSYCENNWVRYRDHWFYFGSDQLLRTGWIQRDNTWYFAADTGELQAGLTKINGNAYYFDSNSCKMRLGNLSISDDTYYFTESGTAGEGPYIYQEFNSNGTVRRGVKQGVR